jgi:hypothetical protein
MMTDRKEIIRGLDAMREFFGYGTKNQHPTFAKYQQILTDTISLIKEQEPVSPTWEQGEAYCGKCGQRLPRKRADREINYCGYCGRPLKWQ